MQELAMKVIGLIGGMSWESTAQYYALLNKLVKHRLGGYHSARLLLYSIDFDEVAQPAFVEKWQEVSAMMVDAARRLERGGADCVLICANTPHIAAEAVEASIGVPLLHIADATGRCILARCLQRVWLLGTAFTMEREFYKSRLQQKFGLRVMVPVPEQRKLVHDIIVHELVYGMVNPESKAKLREVIAGLTAAGAEGIILGCTELPMIVEPTDSVIPLFDTTAIHSEAAVAWALA
jgi:aspartate racemase